MISNFGLFDMITAIYSNSTQCSPSPHASDQSSSDEVYVEDKSAALCSDFAEKKTALRLALELDGVDFFETLVR